MPLLAIFFRINIFQSTENIFIGTISQDNFSCHFCSCSLLTEINNVSLIGVLLPSLVSELQKIFYGDSNTGQFSSGGSGLRFCNVLFETNFHLSAVFVQSLVSELQESCLPEVELMPISKQLSDLMEDACQVWCKLFVFLS